MVEPPGTARLMALLNLCYLRLMFIFFLLVNGTFTINPKISKIKIIDKLIEMHPYFIEFIENKEIIFSVFQIESLKND